MAFQFIVVLSALLAMANAGFIGAPVVGVVHKVANPAQDSVASTHENVVRSFGGTVSTHSKAVDTPYSSVRKTDTRVSNNVYTPAIAKTVSYAAQPTYTTYAAPQTYTTYSAAPAVAKTVSYAAPAPAAVYSHAAPVVYSHPVAKTVSYAAPAFAKTVSYAAPVPAVTKTVSYAAQPTYTSYAAPQTYTTYSAAPAVAKTVSYAAPAVATYAAPAVTAGAIVKQAIAYSPAMAVSHISFDGFGTHWGY